MQTTHMSKDLLGPNAVYGILQLVYHLLSEVCSSKILYRLLSCCVFNSMMDGHFRLVVPVNKLVNAVKKVLPA